MLTEPRSGSYRRATNVAAHVPHGARAGPLDNVDRQVEVLEDAREQSE
jgi:hypothetical protein